jgi:hypothetical protein
MTNDYELVDLGVDPGEATPEPAPRHGGNPEPAPTPTPDRVSDPSRLPTPAPALAPEPGQQTPEALRIQELEAKLARLTALVEAQVEAQVEAPRPATAPAPSAPLGDEPVLELEIPAPAPDNILIHILEDGFTALGQVWYRGQEIEFNRGSRAFQDTCGRSGQSWLFLTEAGQMRRFGKVYFRRGPWPGAKYTDARPTDFSALSALNGDGTIQGLTPADLHRAQQMEANRRRAAPVLTRV